MSLELACSLMQELYCLQHSLPASDSHFRAKNTSTTESPLYVDVRFWVPRGQVMKQLLLRYLEIA